jgi:hypothetical protein
MSEYVSVHVAPYCEIFRVCILPDSERDRYPAGFLGHVARAGLNVRTKAELLAGVPLGGDGRTDGRLFGIA